MYKHRNKILNTWFGIAIVLILNYIFVNKFLSKLKENRKDFLRNNLLWILPVVIIVITVIIIGIKKIRLWLLSYRTNRRGR